MWQPGTLALVSAISWVLTVSFSCMPTCATVNIMWNSPYPSACSAEPATDAARSKAYWRRFGVSSNSGGAFNGDVVTTIYCPHDVSGTNYTFGLWPYYDAETGQAVNGGIPQRGNLTAHLASVARAVEHLFPSPEHSGVVVIDWEMWYPWIIPASRSWYYNESLAFAGGNESLAVQQWNASSLEWMLRTVQLAVRLRPKATWGYYGRPGCYTGWNNESSDPHPGCIASVMQRNSALLPLWRAQTGLFPSIYIGTNPRYGNLTRSHRYVQDELAETLRVRKLIEAMDVREGDTPVRRQRPVIAFTWYAVFSSPCAIYRNCSLMTASSDLDIEFSEPVRDNVDGLIVWGSSGDVDSPAKCNAMGAYVNQTLGPWLRNLSQT